MKLTMRLTLDGLVRGLRGEAHRLADEIEAGYEREARRDARKPPADDAEELKEARDDRAGR